MLNPKLMTRIFSLLLLGILTTQTVSGQIQESVSLELNWSGSSEEIEIPVGQVGFKNAFYDEQIPMWYESKQVSSNYQFSGAILSNLVVENISETTLTAKQKRLCTTTFEIGGRVSRVGRSYFLLLEGRGIRKNNSGFEKLISADIQVNLVAASANGRMMSWDENSVLAEGEWYKIGIAEDGVYRLSRSFLSSLGIDVNAVNPQNINVYGNGGQMLPFSNDVFRYTDPQKNAIYVAGEADGSFDSSDYILFYGKGADHWEYDLDTEKFIHQKHHYSDSAYYFIRVDDTDPMRITQANTPTNSDYQVSSFDDHSFIENEVVNLLKSGRTFFGEKFDLDPLTIPFNISAPNLLAEPAIFDVEAVGRSLSVTSTFDVNAYGEEQSFVIASTGTSSIANIANDNGTTMEVIPTAGSALTVSVTYNKGVASAEGWMDYIRVNYQRGLSMAGSQLSFRSKAALAQAGNPEYIIENATSLFQLWDVSDPLQPISVPFETVDNTTRRFIYPGGTMNEFIAFSDFNYLEPAPNGRVENQNLHAIGQVDMVILTAPSLRPAAEELAELHTEEGLEIVIVEPRQVYNEFSSGNDDVTAIRMLMKMIYDRANGNTELEPQFLQIIGDGTFDNRHLDDDGINIITYQSFGSLSPTQSYVSDDYFGFLDDNAGESLGELMQIGVGRIPANNLQEAQGYVNKVKIYSASNTSEDGGAFCSGDASNSSYGSWRNLITLVSDDRDGNGAPGESFHMTNSNVLANYIYANFNNYDVNSPLHAKV